MRTPMRVSIPVDAGNARIQYGRLPVIFERVLERIRPEAGSFLAERGRRTALVVFDLADPSPIPAIAEPFLMGRDASVEFTPVLNGDELRRGLEMALAAGAPTSPPTPPGTPLRA